MKEKSELDDLVLANQLCFAIYDSSRLFTKFYQKALEPFKLTYPQYIVLLLLWEQNYQSLKDLSDKLYLKSNTLTPLLKRLENSGWIIRKKTAEDKRQLEISLTKKGIEQKIPVCNAVKECVGEKLELEMDYYQKTVEMVLGVNKELKKILGE
ncbi:MarR family transcriptional regulator [Enterococcus devriesei]|uniref:MarR family winged helix-turn-helix transcriptional regulator n=1 Tax=Enterococcus devriesei TaxID=319970 RepID=UPI001C1121CB|nr:MarR family transcriptional regulator [Enterococcus devriesei]MBU5366097.1 MarR family transcriptional regulator [Enterococcus devriesei]MDT2821791.1 MarR family transcriptional regulator [Enterococcus devriesei]